MDRCPDCGSTQCIPWDDGYLCLDCGTEFGSIVLVEDVYT